MAVFLSGLCFAIHCIQRRVWGVSDHTVSRSCAALAGKVVLGEIIMLPFAHGSHRRMAIRGPRTLSSTCSTSILNTTPRRVTRVRVLMSSVVHSCTCPSLALTHKATSNSQPPSQSQPLFQLFLVGRSLGFSPAFWQTATAAHLF
ncbi:hypothetical protein V8C26DRAFT_398417 [Trichoderma gracile]